MQIRIVVFLDFDGVLCNNWTYNKADFVLETPAWGDAQKVWPNPIQLFDPYCIENLNTLCAEYDPDIVISSSWRLKYKLAELIAFLMQSGFKGRVVGRTTNLGDREAEILEYMKNHSIDISDVLVLEDEEDLGTLTCRQVKSTSRGAPGRAGFSYRHLRKARRLLEGKPR